MSRYIDADEFCKQLNGIADMFHAGDKFENVFGVFDIEILINQQTTVDVVKHGHWNDHKQNILDMYGSCSICGFEQGLSDSLKYCPNCGARMDGDEDADTV